MHSFLRRPGAWAGTMALALALGLGALDISCAGGATAPGAPASVAPPSTAPAITAQPRSQTLTAGSTATLSVTSTGTAPLQFQWFKGTTAVGNGGASLVIPSARTTDSGSYTVTVANALASVTSAPASLIIIPAAVANGTLVWRDEFAGPGIDTTKWAFDLGNGPTSPVPLYGWGNGEMEYYTSSRDNADIEDGSLVITAQRQDWGGEPFTSARLVTRGKFSFNGGTVEARIKMPLGDRMWPAFWLLGDTGEPWPKCGEIDIAEMFCGSVGRGDNVMFATAHWWDETQGQALQDSGVWTNPADLSDDYHVYDLTWDAQALSASIDGTTYWSMAITDPTMAELRQHFYYIILNLAVGSPNFGMTSASQADGPLPQKMYVDYVRVYSNTGSTVVDEAAAQPHGALGVLPDGVPCATQLQPVTDYNLFLWNNLTVVPGTPAGAIAVQTTDNSWFGFGTMATKRRNLLNYAAGYLHVAIKTTATDPFQIGINGGNDGNAWVSFVNGADPFGFQRDGQWHSVAIPMTLLGNADFTDIVYYFMVAGTGPVTPGATFAFDQIYWTEDAPENLATPVGGQFGIYTERTCDAGSFDAATQGAINIWNAANFTATAGVPFEGAQSFAFSAPAAAWYGLGFAPARLYDLSAFAQGHLHVALKVPAATATDFKLGMKSPGGTAVRESWIKFKAGADPYGFVRDGSYHEILIPVADFDNSDFAAISQLFMVAGDGPAAMEFDDVYLLAQ